jgi:hypothetical protein
VASAQGSHAEGYGNIQATAYGAHAEGYYDKKAEGYGAHAEGYGGTYVDNGTTKLYGAYGNGTHSEGMYTLANGYGAHSEGYYTKAKT